MNRSTRHASVVGAPLFGANSASGSTTEAALPGVPISGIRLNDKVMTAVWTGTGMGIGQFQSVAVFRDREHCRRSPRS
jgi:hypothetical protein